MMKLKTALLTAIVAASSGFTAAAKADTFFLNYSNEFGLSPTPYAQVDVTAVSGNLLFNVQSLNPTGWTLQSFYFNLVGSVGNVSLMGLPSGWSADSDQNVSMFGVFSDGGKGTGSSNYSAFSFTADSNVNLTLASLGANANGWTFTAHQKCGGGRNHPACSAVDGETSHHIADTPSQIPAPAAAWLLGSALLGFISYRRRSH